MNKKIFIACDTNNISKVKKIIKLTQTKKLKIGYKFGLEFLNTKYGRSYVSKIKKKIIFADLKLHDIPNTIKNGIEAIANLNPYFTTIHITGGDEMQKIANSSKKNVKVLGVSILTSIDSAQAEKYYSEKNINNLVGKFVKNAWENKLDGVVCSPLEIELVKKISSGKLIIVTPGIRPENYNKNDDQKRFMSPKKAVNLGANYLVIGRPITQSSNPLSEITSINSSIE